MIKPKIGNPFNHKRLVKRAYKSSLEAEIVLDHMETGEQITQIPRMEEFMKMKICFF